MRASLRCLLGLSFSVLLSFGVSVTAGAARAADDPGTLPVGADGKPLNLDFERGTLDDWTAEGEAKRHALNEWIRTSNVYDGVADFDAAVRDNTHPTKTLAQYDVGDHLHLNAAGYEAIANSIDLALFRAR